MYLYWLKCDGPAASPVLLLTTEELRSASMGLDAFGINYSTMGHGSTTQLSGGNVLQAGGGMVLLIPELDRRCPTESLHEVDLVIARALKIAFPTRQLIV